MAGKVTRSLMVLIASDYDGRGAKEADRDFDQLGKSGEKAGGKLKTGLKVGAAAAAAGIGLAVVAAKDFTNAAKESEVSGAKMRAQLKASGIAYKAHADQIDDVIAKQSKLSALDDEDLQDSFTNLVRATGDVNEALKLNATAADLSRAKGIEVAKAGEIIGKVYAGNTGTLSRYGIAFDPVTKAQDKVRKQMDDLKSSGVKLSEQQKIALKDQLAEAKARDKQASALGAIETLQKAVGHQAEEYGKTAEGADERWAVTIGNVKETIGAALLPVMARATNTASDFVNQMLEGTGAGGQLVDVVRDVVERTKELARSTADVVAWFREHQTVTYALAAALGTVLAAFAGFKALTAVQAAITATRAAVLGLNAALLANPVGIVVTALAALAAGLVVAYRQSETFRNIVDGTWKTIKTVAGAVLDWLVPKAKATFTFVARFATDAFEGTLLPIVKRTIAAVRTILDGLVQYVRGIVKIATGILSGDWARAWDGAKDVVSGAWKVIRTLIKTGAENALEVIKDLGPHAVKLIGKGLEGLGHVITGALDKSFDWAAKQFKSLPGVRQFLSVGGFVIDKVGGLVGDGLGKSALNAAKANAPAAFGGGLKGARPEMGIFAGFANRLGLHVSSGRRPGAITSSGNVSWHSSGEAIDVAGTPAAMLGFFRQMKSRFGSRLAELIYTPGGVGVKNGKPFSYTGKVAADHLDHVHLAMDLGQHGIGDGFGATAYGPPWTSINGTGVTATGVDLRPAKKAYGVAVDPNVIPLGSKLRIQPNPFNYGGTFTAFDTGGAIKGNRIDFYDWRGRSSQLAWGRRTVQVTVAGGGKDTQHGGKGANAKPTKGVSAEGGIGGYDPTVVYPESDASGFDQRVQGYLDTRAGRSGIVYDDAGRPALYTRPTAGAKGKGLPAGYQAPETKTAPTPTLEDYLNRDLARAALTEDTADDRDVLTKLLAAAQGRASQSAATGDVQAETQALTDIKSLTDAIKSLDDTVAQANAIQQQRDALNQQIADNQLKILELAKQGDAILQAVIAAVNGGIGGKVGSSLMSPGFPGGVANYGGTGRL